MKTSTDFARLLSRFLTDYLQHERNLSPNTIASYRDTFVQLVTYMREVCKIGVERLGLGDLTKDNVTGFLNWLESKSGVGKQTRNCRLAAIHAFVSFLQYECVDRLEQWQLILSIKTVKSESGKLSYLTVDGIKLLLAQPDLSTHQGRRDAALLALFYDTGARVSEIIDLTPSSLRIDSEPYTIKLYGKGRKTRLVPLAKEQTQLLRAYMEENHLFESLNATHPLFFNTRGEKLTRAGMTYIVKKYADMARQIEPELIPEVLSCHVLRHTKAMHLLQAGVNLVYIRDLLGHVSIQTTDVYARADSKQKREALERAYQPLALQGNTTERLWEKDKDLLSWLKNLQK